MICSVFDKYLDNLKKIIIKFLQYLKFQYLGFFGIYFMTKWKYGKRIFQRLFEYSALCRLWGVHDNFPKNNCPNQFVEMDHFPKREFTETETTIICSDIFSENKVFLSHRILCHLRGIVVSRNSSCIELSLEEWTCYQKHNCLYPNLYILILS